MATIDLGKVGGVPLDAYPVGSVYISCNATSPASLFGGTWYQITDVFLIATGAYTQPLELGGTVTHAHGTDGLYAPISPKVGGTSWTQYRVISDTQNTWTSTQQSKGAENNSSSSHVCDLRVPIMGSMEEVSHIPPYFSVYMWARWE